MTAAGPHGEPPPDAHAYCLTSAFPMSGTLEILRLGPPFTHDGGFAWRRELPAELHWALDRKGAARVCPLELTEDGVALGPRHADRTQIRVRGEGRYACVALGLIFASSDNSDPNTNGRLYALRLLAEPPGQRLGDRAVVLPAPAAALPRGQGLRIGVVGTGQRGRSLATKLAMARGVTVAALLDARHGRADYVAADLPAPPVIAHDLAELLAVPGLDAVVIATPEGLHREHAMAALEAGLHVFIDNPIASTLNNALPIVAAARAAGRVLHVGFVLRHASVFGRVRDMLQSGAIGTPRSVVLTDHVAASHGASYFRRWHRDPVLSGGLMVHRAAHDFDLLLWLLGRPALRVASMGGAGLFASRPAPARGCGVCPEAETCPYVFGGAFELMPPDEAADPRAAGLDRCVFGPHHMLIERQGVLIEFAGGVQASFVLDMAGRRVAERRLVIAGDLGTIEACFEDQSVTITPADGSPSQRTRVAALGGYAELDQRSLSGFLAAISAGQSDWASVESSLAALALAEAAELSRHTGRAVEIGAA